MKICIFSDVHGNLTVLKKFLKTKDFLSADKRICLGDVVGIGPYPKECIDLLKKYDIKFIFGNHEGRLIETIKIPETDLETTEHFNNQRKELNEYIDEIKNWPKYYEFSASGEKFLFMHYPWNGETMAQSYNRNEPNSTAIIKEIFSPYDANYIFYGHMHLPFHFADKDKKYIDVGSLGLKCPANYTMLYIENGTIKIEQKQIKYCLKKLLNCFKKIGSPRVHNFVFKAIFNN